MPIARDDNMDWFDYDSRAYMSARQMAAVHRATGRVVATVSVCLMDWSYTANRRSSLAI